MSRRTFSFDSEPLTRVATINGQLISFQIIEAEIGTGTRATVRTFNSTPDALHCDRINLDSELSRKRYVKALAHADPALDSTELAQAFMLLAVDLRAKLAELAETIPPPEAPAVDTATLWELAHELLESPDLLRLAYQAMKSRGLVGEQRNAMLLYIAATARLRNRVVSCFVKGPSSSGKSHLIERVVDLLPQSAYVNYTTISPRFLAYSDHSLQHKIVLIYESGCLDNGIGSYVMRSLLSEGCLRIGTVDHGQDDRMEDREIVKEGPTALFTSTTKPALEAELETRALTLSTIDTPEQSRAIMLGAAGRYNGAAIEPVDLVPFHAAQAWLEVAGEQRVTIPYADKLAETVPTLAIRIRRDFNKLLDLIAACAFLHQVQRPKAEDGAIIATVEDYATVRYLALESFGAAGQDGLTSKQRAAVAAVIALQPEGSPGVSLATIAERLKIDKSAASRRLDNPIKQGYVKNLEERKGHPGRFAPGDTMPAEVSALPDLSVLKEPGEAAP